MWCLLVTICTGHLRISRSCPVCVDQDRGNGGANNFRFAKSNLSVESVECIRGVHNNHCVSFILMEYLNHGMNCSLTASVLASAQLDRANSILRSSLAVFIIAFPIIP